MKYDYDFTYFADILIEYSPIEEVQYLEDMSSWIKFQPVLSSITDPEECRKRLMYELRYNRRNDIVSRILGKFNKLRAQKIGDLWNEYKDTHLTNKKRDGEGDRGVSDQEDRPDGGTSL